MNIFTVYLVEVALCIILGMVFIKYVRAALAGFFKENMSTSAEAEFWIKTIDLMVMVAPIIMVTVASLGDEYATLVLHQELKQTITFILGTQFIGAALIARSVFKASCKP